MKNKRFIVCIYEWMNMFGLDPHIFHEIYFGLHLNERSLFNTQSEVTLQFGQLSLFDF